MKTRRFAIACVLILPAILGYWLAPPAPTSSAAPASAEESPFKGKAIVVTLESKHSLPLEHAQIRKLGDRSFLVGKGSDEGHPANWTKSLLVWVPTNRVEMIVEFGSVEEMKNAWKAYQENMVDPPARRERDQPPEASPGR